MEQAHTPQQVGESCAGNARSAALSAGSRPMEGPGVAAHRAPKTVQKAEVTARCFVQHLSGELAKHRATTMPPPVHVQ